MGKTKAKGSAKHKGNETIELTSSKKARQTKNQ
ncbi:hypothetical protein JOC93_002936 [Priestia taiwanensis]|nr:hypothetical protein [Priestia taiwanensis]